MIEFFIIFQRNKQKICVFFFSSRRRHTRWPRDWSSDVCSSDLTVRVEGPGVSTPVPFCGEGAERGTGGERDAEVPVAIAAPHRPGSKLPVTVIAEREDERAERGAVITVAEPGETIWMVSHFHYDPVWWNTQGQFTQARLPLPDEAGALPDVRTACELVRLHLDAARADPDYKFVLAE